MVIITIPPLGSIVLAIDILFANFTSPFTLACAAWSIQPVDIGHPITWFLTIG